MGVHVVAKQLLTDPKCASARIKRGERPDRLLADGDGLFLRVRQQVGAPTKTWLFLYSLNGKRGKQGLGVYPQVGLALARERARLSREDVAAGVDPALAAKARDRERLALQAAQASRPTVLGVFKNWYDTELAGRKSAAEVKRAMEKDVLPLLGALYADEVKRRDVMRVLFEVKKRGVRRYANYLLQYVRQMFKFAIIQDIVASDPTFGIERKHAGGKSVPRERVLSEDEVHELGRRLAGGGLAPNAQAAFWFILATCCRVGELTMARWSEFDEGEATWTIPAAHTKNGREHLVHLSPFALKQLAILRENRTSKVLVFPARQEKVGADQQPVMHASPKLLQKKFRDRQRTEQISGRSTKLGTLALKSGRWTVHDLRRTGATMMGELGVRPDVIERVLNHKQDKLGETYQRQRVLALRQEAFRLLGERLELLIRQKPGKVLHADFGGRVA